MLASEGSRNTLLWTNRAPKNPYSLEMYLLDLTCCLGFGGIVLIHANSMVPSAVPMNFANPWCSAVPRQLFLCCTEMAYFGV